MRVIPNLVQSRHARVPEIKKSAPFPRRMMALLYDAIAVFTLVYFAAFIPVLVAGGIIEPGHPLLTVYVLVVVFAYFGICWRRGRTLGMQAWRLEIVAGDGERRPQWREICVRFAGAMLSQVLCGAGYLAALFDAENRTWHDRWSHTRLVLRVTERGD